jgi:hypothetical protein
MDKPMEAGNLPVHRLLLQGARAMSEIVHRLRKQARTEAKKYFDEPERQLEWMAAEEIARLRARVEVMRDALQDMAGGWRYIREQHGDLYGVGWDRCEEKARAALKETVP